MCARVRSSSTPGPYLPAHPRTSPSACSSACARPPPYSMTEPIHLNLEQPRPPTCFQKLPHAVHVALSGLHERSRSCGLAAWPAAQPGLQQRMKRLPLLWSWPWPARGGSAGAGAMMDEASWPGDACIQLHSLCPAPLALCIPCSQPAAPGTFCCTSARPWHTCTPPQRAPPHASARAGPCVACLQQSRRAVLGGASLPRAAFKTVLLRVLHCCLVVQYIPHQPTPTHTTLHPPPPY